MAAMLTCPRGSASLKTGCGVGANAASVSVRDEIAHALPAVAVVRPQIEIRVVRAGRDQDKPHPRTTARTRRRARYGRRRMIVPNGVGHGAPLCVGQAGAQPVSQPPAPMWLAAGDAEP